MSRISSRKRQIDYSDDDGNDADKYRRSGKWTPDEESYANSLISDFQRGCLEDCEEGCTLRSYLSQKLQCAPMRISKKFAGRCIGKLSYVKAGGNRPQNDDSGYGYFDDIEGTTVVDNTADTKPRVNIKQNSRRKIISNIRSRRDGNGTVRSESTDNIVTNSSGDTSTTSQYNSSENLMSKTRLSSFANFSDVFKFDMNPFYSSSKGISGLSFELGSGGNFEWGNGFVSSSSNNISSAIKTSSSNILGLLNGSPATNTAPPQQKQQSITTNEMLFKKSTSFVEGWMDVMPPSALQRHTQQA